MQPKQCLLAVFLFLGTAIVLRADDGFPTLQVVPWNGFKAATSLTFDDGDPSHLDVAIPELNQRKMHATFFLIANKITRKDEWRKILGEGHEIGNHTLDHKHANELTPQDEESQVVGAQHVLQKEFGVQVLTFAYPYSEVTPGLKGQIEKGHWLARGGEGLDSISPDREPDWMNIPAHVTLTILPFATYQQWIDHDLDQGAWMVWMIHGLEGTPWGYQPIPKKVFEQILDYLQSKDIWVGTFLEVGSYFRAQKLLEKGSSEVSGASKEWSWTVPASFPPNIVLKIRFGQPAGGRSMEVWQGRQKITPDTKGFYPVQFDLGKLELRLSPK